MTSWAKTGSREAVTAAGDYLSGALYALLRQLYRRGGGNEDFFAVSPGDYDGGLVPGGHDHEPACGTAGP